MAVSTCRMNSRVFLTILYSEKCCKALTTKPSYSDAQTMPPPPRLSLPTLFFNNLAAIKWMAILVNVNMEELPPKIQLYSTYITQTCTQSHTYTHAGTQQRHTIHTHTPATMTCAPMALHASCIWWSCVPISPSALWHARTCTTGKVHMLGCKHARAV